MVDQGNGEALISGTPTATGTASLAVTPPMASPRTPRRRSPSSWAAPGDDQQQLDHLRGVGCGIHLHRLGVPGPFVGETGALPAGITWTDNGNGTATLAGSPDAVTSPTAYPVTIQATDGPRSSSRSLTVAPAPTSGGTIPPVGTPPWSPADTRTHLGPGGWGPLGRHPGRPGLLGRRNQRSVTPSGVATNYGSMAGPS